MIDISKKFAAGPSFQFTFEAPTQGTTVVFGPSGAGKTTLLRCLAGLERPDGGRIQVADQPWFDTLAGVDVPTDRRSVGYVTQEPTLFPHLTAAQNAGFGIAPQGRALRVAEVLGLVGMGDAADKYPHELSGGQKQRVALARAIARKPLLLLLDEPLSALDARARESLRRDLVRFLSAARQPTLLVTHDRTEALQLADRAVLLADGRVLQEGPIADVFSRPVSLDAARVVGVETVVPAKVRDRDGDGLARIDVHGATLTAIDPGPDVVEVLVCIRAEDVIIEAGNSTTSARNRLPGTITGVRDEGVMVRIEMTCSFALTAFITRGARRDLDLKPGSPAIALIKAPSIHLVPRS